MSNKICSFPLEWNYPNISLKNLFSQILKLCIPCFYFQSKDGNRELVCFLSERNILFQDVPSLLDSLSDDVFFVGLVSFDSTESCLFVPQFVVERNGQHIFSKIFGEQNISDGCLRSLSGEFQTHMNLFISKFFLKEESLSQENIIQKKQKFNTHISEGYFSRCIKWKDLGFGPLQEKTLSQISLEQEKNNWLYTCVQAQQKIAKGILEKVVLASRREGSIINGIEENYSVINKIFHSFFDNTEETYQISFRLNQRNSVFLSSPETLCKLQNDFVYVESLAGSSLVGDDQRFLGNPKIQKENQIVSAFIQEILAKYCTQIQQSDLHLVTLGYIQHARSILTGTLSRGKNYWDLISELHPTPAVCGSPRDSAMNFIQTHETFPRQWYAGFGGVFYKNSCDTFVNIRMVHIQDNLIYQYAGAGITFESACEEEAQELKQKLQHWQG